VEIIIPPKLIAGDKFKVSARGQLVTVEVPTGKKGGQKLKVQIKAKPIGTQLSSIHEFDDDNINEEEDEEDVGNDKKNKSEIKSKIVDFGKCGSLCKSLGVRFGKMMTMGKMMADSNCGVTVITALTMSLAVVSIFTAYIALVSFTAGFCFAGTILVFSILVSLYRLSLILSNFHHIAHTHTHTSSLISPIYA
jgi:hypothetical protein